MTSLVNCTCGITHFFHVVSFTYVSTFPSSSKLIWFENFPLNIWYNPWKINSWYTSLKDEWLEQKFYHMLLIGENNVFFCVCVTHAYFFQYCGWARKAVSLKDPLIITQVSMFYIKTIKESQYPSKYNYTSQKLSNCCVTHIWK